MPLMLAVIGQQLHTTTTFSQLACSESGLANFNPPEGCIIRTDCVLSWRWWVGVRKHFLC